MRRANTLAPFLFALLFTLVAALFSCTSQAGPFTDYAENKIIDALFRGQALGAPSTLGIALYTTCPTDSSAGTEVTNANAYARQGLTANLTNFKSTNGTTGSASSGTTGTTTNAVTITFPTATGSWGTIACWGITDSTTYGGGYLWLYQTVTTPPTITNGSAASFAVDAMSIQVDN